ncbi:hypothetical protein ACFW04_011950 [Cataglyphis niger]
MLSELITKSNNKLGIKASTLIMEKNGTNVDDNDVLKFCTGEILMLLQAEEFCTASCDTLSIHSDFMSIFSSSSNNDEIWTNFRTPWDNLKSTVLKRIRSRKSQQIHNTCCCKSSHIIFKILRNCYLNRPHMKRSLSRSLNIPLKKQRKVLSAKARCSNWQPDNYVDSETEDTIEDETEFLRQKIYLYLEVTYPAQRLFLNNVHESPTIQNIKTNVKETEKMLTYGHLKNYKDIINLTELIEIKLIKIIMKQFKEDFYSLFKTSYDMKSRMFYLIIEAIQIEGRYYFYEALDMLMSAYYVFNMEYPTHCACALKFIQNFLNIHPISSTKSRKVATKYKVLSLFNKLRDIEERDVDKDNISSNS